VALGPVSQAVVHQFEGDLELCPVEEAGLAQELLQRCTILRAQSVRMFTSSSPRPTADRASLAPYRGQTSAAAGGLGRSGAATSPASSPARPAGRHETGVLDSKGCVHLEA